MMRVRSTLDWSQSSNISCVALFAEFYSCKIYYCMIKTLIVQLGNVYFNGYADDRSFVLSYSWSK